MIYGKVNKCEKCGHGEGHHNDFVCRRPVDCTDALEAFHKALKTAEGMFDNASKAQVVALASLKDTLRQLMKALDNEKKAADMIENAMEELRETGCDSTCRMNSNECERLLDKALGIDELQVKALVAAIKELNDSIHKLEEAIELADEADVAYEAYSKCVHFPCDDK